MQAADKMSKPKQKQSTLFRAWGGSSHSSSTAGVGSTGEQAREEYGFENFNDLEEFFQDDVTEELARSHKTLPASKGSHSVLNASIIEDIPGFDVDAGELWIYPTNYPIRDYQFNIVQKALFKNTLVCLPTGLGKTFIAAVVMYNFYRWYPSQKIIFLAPTKPLVAQQIEACYNVAGIPQEHAAEMTGNLPPRERVQEWEKRRVFFLTPQVMQNDLARGACPARAVCCVVFDEAHKALGNHAYCQVIKELASAGSRFRVLALSATPGNDLKAVQQVVTNLQIGQIELRCEDSFDIRAYVHERKVEKKVVPIEGELLEVKNAFLKVLSGVVSRLSQHNLLYHSNPDRLSKFQLLQARDQFRQAGPPPGVQSGALEGDFALAISLYHAYELLQQHGMRSFYQFLSQPGFSGGPSRAKLELLRGVEFAGIMRSLEERLGSGSDIDCGRVGRSPRTIRSPRAGSRSPAAPFFYSHPKLNTLEEVVLGHFRSFQDRAASSGSGPSCSVSTRVMIFSQYRDSVQEIAEMLSRHAPLVRVMSFVGHGSSGKTNKGLTQKEQTEVVRKFREGGYNTLVATCVGEEGLDIGEVDLIVCFDAHKSPIRLVQRMGRTGRKRGGRIVVIVAQGKEEQTYLKSQSNKNSIHRAIRDGCKSLRFFPNSLRLVPRHIRPTAHKMHMTIGEFAGSSSSKAGRKGKSKSVQLWLGLEKGSSRKDGFLSDTELACWSENYALSDRDFRAVEKAVEACVAPQSPFLSIARLNAKQSGQSLPSVLSQTSPNASHTADNTSLLNSSATRGKYSLSLGKWVHWQTAPVPHKVVGGSLRTKHLTSALEFMDMLHASEEVVQGYEMEMQTFLNTEDVKVVRSEEVPGGAGGRRRGKKRRRVLDDSTDDEDFQSAGARPVDKPPSERVPPVQELECQESSTGGVSPSHKSEEGQDVIVIDLEEDGAEMEDCDDCYEVPAETVGGGNLAASQHAIPRPPSMESLDWLDAIEPSQVSTPKESHSRRRTKPSSLRGTGFGGSKFEFVTPRAPPRPHTPFRTSHVQPKMPRYADSIDLFSDLSPAALLGDFSDVGLYLGASSARKAETDTLYAGHDKSPSRLNPEWNRAGVGDVELDLNVTVVAESDVEDQDREGEETKPECDDDPEQVSPIGAHPTTPVSEPGKPTCVPDTSEDSFILTHGRKSRKEPNVLRSPATPTSVPLAASTSVSPGSKENSASLLNWTERHFQCPSSLQQVKHRRLGRERRGRRKAGNGNGKTVVDDSDSSSDEFAVPLMQRLKKSKTGATETKKVPETETSAAGIWKERGTVTGSRPSAKDRKGCGFVEEEAELSDDLFGGSSDETEPDPCDYDCEDSFINDATMLTQVSPTQRPAATSRAVRSPPTAADMYRRSLMSPDTLFAGKCRGCGNQYRMVFSQRHRLLDHYIKKAGLQVAPGAKKPGKRGRLVSGDWNGDEAAAAGISRDGTASSSSSSEAEEVQCVEEDLEELSCSEGLENSEQLCGEDSGLSEVGGPLRKRRAALLSESDQEGEAVGLGAGPGDPVRGGPQPRPGSPPETTPLPSTGKVPIAGGSEGLSVARTRLSSAGSLRTPCADEVISPSLLASIRIRRTPACFSLGMDDWLTDSGSEGGGEEGENPLVPGPLQPTGAPTHRQASSDVDPEAVGQEVSSDLLDAPLTEEELERNFDFEVDDCEVMDTESAHSRPACHQTPEAPVGTDRPSQEPATRGARGNQSPTASLPSTESRSDSSTATRGTILVSSREVAYSQVVSTLRNKHHLSVLLCPLSHGGFIVSNRMAVERKLQSDLSAAPTGGKILSRLQELGELFGRTCLIVEKDPAREGRSRAKPGHYMEYAVARLVASNVTLLFSQSQEDSAALLAKLVEAEGRKGHTIALPDGLQQRAQPVLQLLLKVPLMNYITALNVCASFKTLLELVQCSPEELKRRIPSLQSARAQGIFDFFHHTVNPNLVS